MHDAIIGALIDWKLCLEGPLLKELMAIDRDYSISTFLAIPVIKILEAVPAIRKKHFTLPGR